MTLDRLWRKCRDQRVTHLPGQVYNLIAAWKYTGNFISGKLPNLSKLCNAAYQRQMLSTFWGHREIPLRQRNEGRNN